MHRWKTLTITINERDWATQGAGAWNCLTTLGFNYVTINPRAADWAEEAITKIQAFQKAGCEYERVIIAGHGTPADLAHVAITPELLENSQSGAYRFLRTLGEVLNHSQAEIEFRCCCVAAGQPGKDFIVSIAEITGATVRAYDDWYAITPFGREWIAENPRTTGSSIPRPGKQYPPFKGSLLQRIWVPKLGLE